MNQVALLLFIFCSSVLQESEGQIQKIIPDPNLDIAERRSYLYEQTIVIVDYNESSRIQNCSAVHVHDETEVTALIEKFPTVPRPLEADLQTIMKFLRDCDAIDKATGRLKLTTSESQVREELDKSSSVISLLHGSIPGTKWCGVRDSATSYFDLGPFVFLDSCCRAYSLCPVKIFPIEKRYTLKNRSNFIYYHCTCHKAFYRCLKNQRNDVTNSIGVMYFNFLSVPCIENAQSNEPIQDELEVRLLRKQRRF